MTVTNTYFENQAADGNSSEILADGAIKNIALWGDFGGGTATLKGSPDNGTTWITLKKNDGTDATFTTNSIEKIDVLKNGLLSRLELAGSTTPDLNAKVF